MIIDAVLLALPKVMDCTKDDIAIMPGMRLAPADGVQITNPLSGFQLWLDGSVDYAVIKYEKDINEDNKGGTRMFAASKKHV